MPLFGNGIGRKGTELTHKGNLGETSDRRGAVLMGFPGGVKQAYHLELS